ncbi:MAG: hypothetical protein IJ708_06445 [Clostridia bacterium]|nr:hypothetical protein [Clostridia bacterium]
MKITFLGTGAGESYPGLWCNCPHCAYARLHRGRNIRANSCAVVDDTLMLDMGPMAFDAAARFGVDLTGITHLLVTHNHEDHFYPMHLHWREVNEDYVSLPYEDSLDKGGPRFTPLPELTVCGNRYVEKTVAPYIDQSPSPHAHFQLIKEGEMFMAGPYRVTPICGNHHERGFSHSYVISRDEKTLLYALDTGTYDPDMQSLLLSFRYDAIVMEGTTGLNEQYGGHMCLQNNRIYRQLLLEHHCIEEETPFVLTHMSPHWCPPHDQYVDMVAPYGLTVAYDGMTLSF